MLKTIRTATAIAKTMDSQPMEYMSRSDIGCPLWLIAVTFVARGSERFDMLS